MNLKSQDFSFYWCFHLIEWKEQINLRRVDNQVYAMPSIIQAFVYII